MSGRVANITTSFIELPGLICTSVYLSGCLFGCQGCQNPELQNKFYGKLMCVQNVIDVISDNNLASCVCFLGGEPFYQSDFLYELCKNITKPIGIYTGNTFEVVCQKYQNIIDLPNVKFIKTGKFEINKIVDIEFPITSNQIVYTKINNNWVKCESRDLKIISNMLRNIL